MNVFNTEIVVNSWYQAVFSRQSAVGNLQSAICSRQSAVGSRQSAITNHKQKTSNYSHSIVAGGLELMSYTTRFTPFTRLMISLETLARKV